MIDACAFNLIASWVGAGNMAGGMAGLVEAVQKMVAGKADKEDVQGLRRLLGDKVNLADHQVPLHTYLSACAHCNTCHSTCATLLACHCLDQVLYHVRCHTMISSSRFFAWSRHTEVGPPICTRYVTAAYLYRSVCCSRAGHVSLIIMHVAS